MPVECAVNRYRRTKLDKTLVSKMVELRAADRERGLLPRDATENLSVQMVLLEARVARRPAVAVRHLVTTIGSYRLYRTIARDHDVARAVLGPRARIGPDATLSAEGARLRK
jgi:hypothetical protein